MHVTAAFISIQINGNFSVVQLRYGVQKINQLFLVTETTKQELPSDLCTHLDTCFNDQNML